MFFQPSTVIHLPGYYECLHNFFISEKLFYNAVIHFYHSLCSSLRDYFLHHCIECICIFRSTHASVTSLLLDCLQHCSWYSNFGRLFCCLLTSFIQLIYGDLTDNLNSRFWKNRRTAGIKKQKNTRNSVKIYVRGVILLKLFP